MIRTIFPGAVTCASDVSSHVSEVAGELRAEYRAKLENVHCISLRLDEWRCAQNLVHLSVLVTTSVGAFDLGITRLVR